MPLQPVELGARRSRRDRPDTPVGPTLDQPRHPDDIIPASCAYPIAASGCPFASYQSVARTRRRGRVRSVDWPARAAPGIDGSGTTRHHQPAAPGKGWSAPATLESPRSRSGAPRRRVVRTSVREPRSSSEAKDLRGQVGEQLRLQIVRDQTIAPENVAAPLARIPRALIDNAAR